MNPLLKKIKNITDGWVNMMTRPLIFQPMAMQRAEICAACEHCASTIIGEYCTQCSCLIDAKTWAPGDYCPLGKWNAVIDENGNFIQ